MPKPCIFTNKSRLISEIERNFEDDEEGDMENVVLQAPSRGIRRDDRASDLQVHNTC
jgi:hypothetical protein